MLALRRRAIAVFASGLLFGLSARADDEPVSLDSVDTGQMRSLDSVDTGKTRSLDSVDTGETVDQDSLDVGRTNSLDSADTGHTDTLDSVDTGRTESLSQAETPPAGAPSTPAPLPQIHGTALRADAKAARDALIEAEKRALKANAEYSEMRAHDYPRGEAAAAIVKEYEEAQPAYEAAKERYQSILDQVDPAALGD